MVYLTHTVTLVLVWLVNIYKASGFVRVFLLVITVVTTISCLPCVVLSLILTDATCLTSGVVTTITNALDRMNIASEAYPYSGAYYERYSSLVPWKEDFFMSYSTLPGSLSFRHRDTGAYYIKHLDSQLRNEENRVLPLDRVLNKVTQAVKAELTRRSEYQLPFFVYTTGKLIYLWRASDVCQFPDLPDSIRQVSAVRRENTKTWKCLLEKEVFYDCL